MARPLRVEFAGAVYHVMARGNERRDVFRDDRDRERFLETVGEAVERFDLRLHAYCLMPNHYHLVVETPVANLSRALGWLQTTYMARFNARHRRVGHLFQGRYKAQLVEADEYARWLVEYVHLNPVRPRQKAAPLPLERREELERYRWSSHRAYAGRERRVAGWLCLDWQRYWGRTRRAAVREYRAAIERMFGRAVRNPWEGLQQGLVLGGEELLRRSTKLLERKSGLEEAHWTREASARRLRARVRELVANETNAAVAVWARVRLGQERPSAVAGEQGYRSASGVTMLLRRLEARAQHDRKLSQRMEALREKVNREK